MTGLAKAGAQEHILSKSLRGMSYSINLYAPPFHIMKDLFGPPKHSTLDTQKQAFVALLLC